MGSQMASLIKDIRKVNEFSYVMRVQDARRGLKLMIRRISRLD